MRAINIIRNFTNCEQLYLNYSGTEKHMIWEIESRCRLRCKYCYPSRMRSGSMEKERVDWLISELNSSEIRNIHLTGGEPTQNPYLEYIVSYLKRKQIYITTNLLDNVELIEKLLIKYTVYSIAVSLDSIRPEINDIVRGNTDRVIDNLKRIIMFKEKYGLKTRIRIHCVISKINLDYITELLYWAKNLGIDEVSCQPVSVEKKQENYDLLHLEFEDVDSIQKVLQEENALFGPCYAESHLKLVEYYLKNRNCYLDGLQEGCSVFVDATGEIWNCPRKIKKLDSLTTENKVENCRITLQCMTCLKRFQIILFPYALF